MFPNTIVLCNIQEVNESSVSWGLTDDSQLSVGVFDAPVVLSNALVHSRVIEGETGELQLPLPILDEHTRPK